MVWKVCAQSGLRISRCSLWGVSPGFPVHQATVLLSFMAHTGTHEFRWAFAGALRTEENAEALMMRMCNYLNVTQTGD